MDIFTNTSLSCKWFKNPEEMLHFQSTVFLHLRAAPESWRHQPVFQEWRDVQKPSQQRIVCDGALSSGLSISWIWAHPVFTEVYFGIFSAVRRMTFLPFGRCCHVKCRANLMGDDMIYTCQMEWYRRLTPIGFVTWQMSQGFCEYSPWC
jgi:hypothetical protein